MQVNRTLQGLIYKYLTNNNTWRYIDSLQDLVKSYWKRIHSTIGIFPLDAEKDESAMYHGIYSSVIGFVDNSISKFVFINLPKFLLKKPPTI